jgi:DNA-binding MarR family transcriptional regulator
VRAITPESSEDESLADLFWLVARRMRRLGRDSGEHWEITPGQFRALGVLMRHGSMRLSALSEHLRIAPRSTTEVVDGLQERGLVSREADPTDRRATLVTLTPQGEEVGAKLRAARQAEAERFFGSLPDQDRAELTRILRSLLA